MTVYEWCASDSKWNEHSKIVNNGKFMESTLDYTAAHFSGDGGRIIIGVTNGLRNYATGGQALIYEYDSGRNVWDSIGEIDVETNTDFSSGLSVAMSDDGSIVAVGTHLIDGINGDNPGHVRVYQQIGDNWVQLGGILEIFQNFNEPEDFSAMNLALSADGLTMIVSTKRNDDHFDNGNLDYVRIFKFNPGKDEWVKLGEEGVDVYDNDLPTIATSDDGSVIAAVQYLDDQDGFDHVRVYRRQDDDTWVQVGENVRIIADSVENFGVDVALSADGLTMVIGAKRTDGFHHHGNEGHVLIYQFDSRRNTWDSIGYINVDAIIDSSTPCLTVAMSNDGSIIAIGAYGNGSRGTDSGQVLVYRNDGDKWVQVGEDVDVAESTTDFFGVDLVISADGLTITVGLGGSNSNSDYVRVFCYNETNGNWQEFKGTAH